MSSEVHEGQILAGKFRIERVLGQGGMGVVVAARHLQLEERVALKFLLPEALGNPIAVERFAREARAAVKIKSEHVARVSDVGTLESGSPYMVMEYLQGEDLANWVRRYGAMPIPDAIEFLLQACEAIGEAHALGIVHRDLKPANLFVTHRADGSPCIKVLDFGISKLTATASGGAPELEMTRTQAVMGSPLYMSPEQMSSTRNVDTRTDIWALGVIFYEMLTGRVPFEAETMPQLCGMNLQDPPRPLRQLRPDVPEGLEAIVLRCLEKPRERRFNNVADLALSLAPYGSAVAQRSAQRIARVLGAAGIPSAPNPAPFAVAVPGQVVTATDFGASTPKKKSKSWVTLVLGALALLLGGGALLWARGTAAPEPAVEPVAVHSVVTPASAPAVAPAVVVAPAAPAPVEAATASTTPEVATASALPSAGPKPGPSKRVPPKPAPAVPQTTTAPAIDPLDGRR